MSDAAGERGSTIERSRALHARARAFVRAFEEGAPMPEPFDALACDLARHQHDANPGYARLCARRGVDVATLARAQDAPAVPTDAFKLTRVFAFPEHDAVTTFRTSGTTLGQRGRHLFRDTSTYDAAAIAFGRRALVRATDPKGAPARVPLLVLGPPPSEMQDSSLVHMMEAFRASFGEPASIDETYFLRDGTFELAALDERVAKMVVEERPVLLLGTSFAFVHFLDAMGEDTFRLPSHSRVMQTGGFKGKSREVDAPTLRKEIARVFCIDPGDVVSEYGMTELSSQFYTRAGAARSHGDVPVYEEPPWARVTPVDPESLEPVAEGKVGIARITDLMNVDSAVAVLAQDRVRRADGGGFELLGRLPGAPPRGCSIAADEMLGGN
jgi:hypothetical protein